MANVNGKAYGLTAMTRMHPLKTFGLRAVFAAIQISLLPPAKRGAIAGGIAGPALVAVGDGVIRLLIKLGVAIPVWRPAHDIGAALGLAGGVATLAGAVALIAGFAVVGAVVGSVYQPRWTLLGKISQIQTDLTNLSFIHFARWVIIKRNEFPRLAADQPTEKLNYDYLLFESNFNGDWEKYIDAFSDVIPGGMDNIWRWSVRYPSSRPITPFLNYIRNCQYDTDHYYSAYPGASTNDVLGALALESALGDFVESTASCSAQEFAKRYARFTVQVQNYISTTGAPPFPPAVSSARAAVATQSAPPVTAPATVAEMSSLARPRLTT
jgi:hypothetical protein